MLTIRNDFTGNETRIRASIGDVISADRCRRIARRLHAAGCASGGPLGERGPQDFAYQVISAAGDVRITRVTA